MPQQKSLALIRQVGEEILGEEELIELLKHKEHLVAYDGFEPSGRVHIAQGILRAITINKMVKAGCKFKMFVADWHALANNKMGGDLAKIQLVGKYLIEVWKAAGMDLSAVEFVWASELVKDEKYWRLVLDISRSATVKRITRCAQIMGRAESDALQASQILYPCMQCADIFYLGANITQLGMDQRKVNVLARELGPSLGYYKPIVVSHHMLMGLGQPPAGDLAGADRAIQLKMSKSIPDSAIFMDDSEEEVNRKIRKAYCPEKVIDENPILEYCKYIIFEKIEKFEIKRPEKFGGDLVFHSYDELAAVFVKGDLHPMDLKSAVASYLNQFIAPVREHFVHNKEAHALLEQVKSFQVTR